MHPSEKENNNVLVLQLRALRERCGITVKQLSEAIGVSPTTISRYETGQRQADYETLLRLREYFGVTIDCLLGKTTPIEYADKSDASDTTFYEEYNELTEEQKAAVREIVRVLRNGKPDKPHI